MRVKLLALILLPCLLAAWECRAQALPDDAMAVHVLGRLSFGPFPGEIERVRAMGWKAYVEEQLNPEKLPLPQALTARLAALGTESMDTVQLFREYGPKAPGGPRRNPTLEEIQAAKEKASFIQTEAAEAKLWRAILSPRQLEEILCDFWYNHFNVPASKGLAHLWVGSFEREAIRPHVLGRFGDMLLAVTRHPAMLIHLENWQSASPESQAGKGLQRPLVEMHARELLTAHTMGEAAKARPQDVNALANMLAGWSIGAPRGPQDVNGFVFDERRHDSKDREFMGTVIKGGGMSQGLEAIRVLAARPETARNICGKLARFFVAEEPPKALVEDLSKKFLDTGGDIKAVLAALFESRDFADSKHAWNRIKSPLRYVVSIVRAAGRPVGDVRSLAENLEWLGQGLYDAPGVSGHKDESSRWLAADLFLKRLNWAVMAGRGALPCWSPGNWTPLEKLDQGFLARTMGLKLAAGTAQAVEQAAPELKAGVLLGSPEGQLY